jgi:hypothetical protein
LPADAQVQSRKGEDHGSSRRDQDATPARSNVSSIHRSKMPRKSPKVRSHNDLHLNRMNFSQAVIDRIFINFFSLALFRIRISSLLFSLHDCLVDDYHRCHCYYFIMYFCYARYCLIH